MRIIEVSAEHSEAWDAYVRASPHGSFLQSWAWGEFQRAAGFAPLRLAVVNDASKPWDAVNLVMRRPLPFRRFSLYSPWGPVFREAYASDRCAPVLHTYAEALRDALRGGGIFARVEPKISSDVDIAHALKEAGFLRSERSIQPRDTRMLDLTQSEVDLLRAMHPKTRYNIRLARRRGVTVAERIGAVGMQIFLTLAREVQRRGEFHYHPESYYRAMLDTLGPAGMLTILVAEYQGVPLAANLLIHFGTTITYAHGASSNRQRHVMAPVLLQWEGIVRAKAAGATRYDFFGIAPPHAPATHPWFGITRFKEGFGGTTEHYFGAADVVTDIVTYRTLEIGRSLRALLR